MDDLEKEYCLSDGRLVVFKVDEFEPAVDVVDSVGKDIGRIEFDDLEDCYLLVHAEIASEYQRKGVGIAALRFLVDMVPGDYAAWVPDGQKYEDARHLSVEGAAFASRAVELGLIRWADSLGGPTDDW